MMKAKRTNDDAPEAKAAVEPCAGVRDGADEASVREAIASH